MCRQCRSLENEWRADRSEASGAAFTRRLTPLGVRNVRTIWIWVSGAILLISMSHLQANDPPPKIRLLIIDGQNNHDWRATTAYLRTMFQDSGRFTVDIATAPPSPQSPDGKRYVENPEQYDLDISAFWPHFENYDVILLNYNGFPWPEKVHEALEKSIDDGKGLVVIHAADNSFPNRANYNRMIGLGWRPKSVGTRLLIDDAGQITRVPPGEGIDSGHGKREKFQITVRAPDHPIMVGMPPKWMHARDELYHGLRGPAEDMTILATATMSPAKDGTGLNEPVAWAVSYGKGRVFHTPLGHDVAAMKCVGFETLVLRGTEWAATGKVTIHVPDDFPTADSTSTRGGWSFGESKKDWLPWLLGAVAISAIAIIYRLCRRRREVTAK